MSQEIERGAAKAGFIRPSITAHCRICVRRKDNPADQFDPVFRKHTKKPSPKKQGRARVFFGSKKALNNRDHHRIRALSS